MSDEIGALLAAVGIGLSAIGLAPRAQRPGARRRLVGRGGRARVGRAAHRRARARLGALLFLVLATGTRARGRGAAPALLVGVDSLAAGGRRASPRSRSPPSPSSGCRPACRRVDVRSARARRGRARVPAVDRDRRRVRTTGDASRSGTDGAAPAQRALGRSPGSAPLVVGLVRDERRLRLGGLRPARRSPSRRCSSSTSRRSSRSTASRRSSRSACCCSRPRSRTSGCGASRDESAARRCCGRARARAVLRRQRPRRWTRRTSATSARSLPRRVAPIRFEPDGPMYAHTRIGFADLRVLDAAETQVPWRRLPAERGSAPQDGARAERRPPERRGRCAARPRPGAAGSRPRGAGRAGSRLRRPRAGVGEPEPPDVHAPRDRR